MKNLVLAILLAVPIFGKTIYQSGTGTAESKTEACRIALENAQKEALYQSGINIVSIYEKTQVSDSEIKKIINYNLQSSYGFVQTLSKDEKFEFNYQTGYISCKVDGEFEVDTSKLKAQLSALSTKYKNISNEENERAEKLEEKNRLLAKYSNLKNQLTSNQSFYISDSYSCGENLSLSQCKTELKRKISKTFQKKLAKKYQIDTSSIRVGEIELKSEIETTVRGMLVANYSGQVSGKAISVRNPYLDEINSLNAYLGERQIFEEIEEEVEDDSPSWYDGMGTSVWNGITTVLGFPFRDGNKIEYLTGFTAVKIEEFSWNYNFVHERDHYRVDLRLATGSIKWNLDGEDISGSAVQKLEKYDYSKYSYQSIGLELSFAISMLRINYILPEKGENFVKVDLGLGYNVKHISIFVGTHVANTSDKIEWEQNNGNIFLNLGFIF